MGCPGLSAVRGQLYGAMDEALLSLKYDVSLGAAVSDASHAEASRRLVGARGRAVGARERLTKPGAQKVGCKKHRAAPAAAANTMALGQLARREGDVPFTKNNARGKASLTPGTRSLQRQQAVARKLATKSQKAQRGGVLPLHERPASPCSVIMEADIDTVGRTALKGAKVALHGAKVTAGYGISTARVAGSYSLIASRALYATAATLWASLAVAAAVLVGGVCFLVSTMFEMSRRVKVASRGFVKVAQFAGRSMKLSIQASSYAGRVAVAMWTRLTAGCSRGFEASLALFVVVSGLCLEAF